MEQNYISFTKEMKKNYTILVPNMLPLHFKLIVQVLKNYGYNAKLLETQGHEIIETGLKYVHNDTCYPAILVIGQFIDALQSGKYNVKETALVLFQTGGGCRASNYIFLLRKALERAGYGYVPVISINIAGLEKHPGFNLTPSLLHCLFYAITYGDFLMSLVNQCKPYELNKGDSEALAERLTVDIASKMKKEGISFKKVKKNCKNILKEFSSINVLNVPKILVGVVGEIFVKYSPLANNNLEQFLIDEGAEVVVPGLLDFFLYTVNAYVNDYKLYGLRRLQYPVMTFLYNLLLKQQKTMISLMEDNSRFVPGTPMEHTMSLVKGYIGFGAKMGEGWLLPAEMLELYDRGVVNIVCTQPFGCLPNHICGKGMMKPLKDKNPDINIIAIDYDAGATKVNQENRIKLMLANARESFNSAAKAESDIKPAVRTSAEADRYAIK